MDHRLTFRGYAVPNDSVPLDELSVVPTGGRVPVNFYRKSSRWTFLPRSWGIEKFGLPATQVFTNLPADAADDPHWKFGGSLRPAQESAVDAFLANPKQCGVFHVRCGWGKTVAALAIASRLRLKCLVVVNEEDLGHQWVERAGQYLPNARVGWIQGPRFDDPSDHEVTVGMLQTLSMRDWGDYARLAQFGLVIVDEAHCIGSEVYTRALMNFTAPWALGLSATPRRTDGLTAAIHWFLGPTIFEEPVVKDAGVSVRVVHFSCDDADYNAVHKLEYGPNAGCINTAKQMNQLADCGERNDVVVALINELLEDPERHVLVLSDRREQIDALAARLEVASGQYVGRNGGNAKQHRERIEQGKKCRVVFGTFQKARQALDIATLNALVMVSPKKDVEQAVGRVLRVRREERVCPPVVIDIVDDGHPNLKRQAAARKKWYKGQGFTIT